MNEKEQKKPPAKVPPFFTIFVIISIFIVLFVVFGQSKIDSTPTGVIDFGRFMNDLKDGNYKEVELEGYQLTAKPHKPYTIDESGKEYSKIRTDVPPGYLEGATGYEKIREYADKTNPKTNFKYNPPNYFLRDVVLPLIPWLLIVFIIWFLFFRQLRGPAGQGNFLNFAKSKAKVVQSDRMKITFDDVAGIEEAKDEVKELVDFLKNPQKFRKLGGQMPKGILLVGSPGTGKTLLAKAISGEAGVPFFSMSGSDFVEMFVGVGAARVRDLFQKAKENAPCILFLDEIDAVGRKRGSGLGGGHDEREQTLNQILVEMDGFDTDKNVIVIAATNRPDILDPALLRPGRFDRQITIDLPDVKGREEILKVHCKKIKLDKNADLSVIAKTTPMLAGAELAAVINEAAILASTKNSDTVNQEHLEESRDKIMWGRQKKSRVLEAEDKTITAYHEAGHALIATLLHPLTEPLHKVTIIPRGPALGVTMTLPERDRLHMSKKYCLATITKLMGGRVAEEQFCKDISAGARDDIKKATQLAKAMVCEWGMSEKLGPIAYTDEEEHLFLGREISRTKQHSEKTALEIDSEIKGVIDSCYNNAVELITKNKDKLEIIAKALIEKEVLSGNEVRSMINGSGGTNSH